MRQAELRAVVADLVVDVHDLVDFLELTIEDILIKHPKALREHAYKFGIDLEEEAEE